MPWSGFVSFKDEILDNRSAANSTRFETAAE